ncbi:glycosyltransferase family 39 protein [Candidatus Calescamantes bacterium]|nr:glycosyltransferase family 39 protein [Candidatus Calescamantes bacterium]
MESFVIPKEKRVWDKKLLILIILGLLIRLFYIATIPPSFIDATDPREYDSLAQSILNGEGLKNEDSFLGGVAYSYRPPLYPVFLAFIYFLFGHSYLAVRIIQVLLSACLIFLIFNLTKTIFGEKAAFWAGLGTTFCPEFIYYAGTLRPTLLHTFFLLLSFYLLYSSSSRRYIWAGFALGLATLTRAVSFYLVFFIPIFIGLVKGKNEMKKTFLFPLAFLLTISPWAIRNYRIQGEILFTSYESGYSLWLAHNPKTLKRERGEIFLPHCYFPEDKKYLKLSEKEKNKYFKKEAFKYIYHHPKEFFINFFTQLKYFYRPYPNPRYIKRKYVIISSIFTFPLFAFSFYGTIISRKQWKNLFLLYLVILYYTLVYSLFTVVIRYRVPIIPYFLVFAGKGLENFSLPLSRHSSSL